MSKKQFQDMRGTPIFTGDLIVHAEYERSSGLYFKIVWKDHSAQKVRVISTRGWGNHLDLKSPENILVIEDDDIKRDTIKESLASIEKTLDRLTTNASDKVYDSKEYRNCFTLRSFLEDLLERL